MTPNGTYCGECGEYYNKETAPIAKLCALHAAERKQRIADATKNNPNAFSHYTEHDLDNEERV